MRVLVFLLALMTSPLGAVVCEVACAGHALAGHHAAAPETVVEDHHHHGEGAPEARRLEAEAGTDVGPCGLNGRVGQCAPLSGQPATLRTAVTPRVKAPALDAVAVTIHSLDLERQHTGEPPVGSAPPPPLLATIPLRV